MSDHLVRVGHLKDIQKANEWLDADLARMVGRSQQQVSSWFSGQRQIGEKLARDLEDRLGLLRYSLDERPSVIKAMDATPEMRGSVKLVKTLTTKPWEAPVLHWAEIQRMLDVDNGALKQKAPHLETFASASPRAKFVQMPDDSMADVIQTGDHLLIDPAEAPRAGDTVLIRLPSGEHFVRLFRPRTAYVFEATAANEAYQSLSSTDDGAVVVGVLIEHRRYRRPA